MFLSQCLIRLMVVVMAAVLFADITHAETLKSTNFQIDTFGFITNDSQLDIAVPTITEGPSIVSSAGTTTIIQWKTDIVSNSIVAYGLTSSYITETGQSEEQVKDHTVKLTALLPNTTYHFQVKSMNATGRVGRSKDQTFGTSSELNISEVQISDITLSSAIISWKTASILTSEVLYGRTTQYGQRVIDQSASGTTNHAIRLSGLDSGAIYHFQIIGLNAENQPIASDDYIFTTLTLPSISKLTIGSITGNTAEISWETNIPTDSFISFWKLDEEETKATSQGSPELATKHRLVLTGLVGKTEYRFRVIGRDGSGNRAQTEVLSFKTPLDAAPPIINDVKSEISTSSKDDRLQLIVSWNTDEPATGKLEYNVGAVLDQKYKLESKQDAGLAVNHILIINDLKPSTNYHFRIQSVDEAGNAGFSSDYSVLTPQKRKSLLQFILERLEDIFGWLRNIKL